jgi:ABC-type polysaccharide/polyol phosphate transport system ATPase subunit
MGPATIEVQGVGKRYRLGEQAAAYGTLRDSLSSVFRRRGGDTKARKEFWALRDVDLTIHEGEALGLVGGNGAGKTTLLRILARITDPTVGVTRTRGRVGALLEVGTGFHPELSGRDNVFLSGAVMGMTRRDIRRRFDEIVEFSGVEQFIDTPLKRYSSGMRLRLAFAVAAHLEPELMLVDEVLAVGDSDFQRRSLARMATLREEGGRSSSSAMTSGRSRAFAPERCGSITGGCRRRATRRRSSRPTSGPCWPPRRASSCRWTRSSASAASPWSTRTARSSRSRGAASRSRSRSRSRPPSGSPAWISPSSS